MKRKKNVIESLFVLLIVLIPFSGLSKLLDYIYYFITLVAFSTIILKVCKKEKKIKININNILTKLIIIYIAYMALSLLFLGITDVGVKYIILFGTLGFWLLTANYTSEFVENIQKTILIFEFILCFSIFASMINNNFIPTFFKFLLPSSSKSYNIFLSDMKHGIYAGLCFERALAGVFLDIGIGVICSRYIAKNKLNFKEIFLLILMFLALFSTGKRMLTIVPVLSFLIMLFLNNKKDFIKQIVGIFVLFMILGYLVYNVVPSSQKVFKRFLSDKNSTTELRYNMFWKYSLDMFRESPILGHGPHSFLDHLSKQRNDNLFDGHNIYFQMLGENGILGTILLLSIFANGLIKVKRIINKSVFLNKEKQCQLVNANFSLYLQLMFLIYGITGNGLYVPAQLFVYFMALVIIIQINNEGVKKNEDWDINIS